MATGTFVLRYLFSPVKQVKYSLQNFVFHCKNEAKTSPQVTPLHAITNGLIGFLPSFDIHFPNPVTFLQLFLGRFLSSILSDVILLMDDAKVARVLSTF